VNEPDPEPAVPDDESDVRHAERLAIALAAVDDETLRRALATMSETNRLDVGNQLQLPRASLSLGEALVPLVRRKVRSVPFPRQLAVAFALNEPVNDDTIEALGERHENPTRDDMIDVLPAIVERHGVPAVTLMLAAYAASDADCQEVFAEILDTDERFELPDELPPEEPGSTGVTTARREVRDDDEQEAKRAQRKAAKDAKRAAEARQREAKATAAAKQKQARRKANKRRG
jgi:hypothetical protein